MFPRLGYYRLLAAYGSVETLLLPTRTLRALRVLLLQLLSWWHTSRRYLTTALEGNLRCVFSCVVHILSVVPKSCWNVLALDRYGATPGSPASCYIVRPMLLANGRGTGSYLFCQRRLARLAYASPGCGRSLSCCQSIQIPERYVCETHLSTDPDKGSGRCPKRSWNEMNRKPETSSQLLILELSDD